MPRQTLFCERFATHDSVLDFDYKHGDEALRERERKWVKVSVNIRGMTLDYKNISGEHSGPHGEVSERGAFSSQIPQVNQPQHVILFRDFHSPHGFEQNQLFKQVGPFTWKSKHRTGATVILVLRKPGSGPHNEIVAHCGLLPDVMPAPPPPDDDEFEQL